jgi:hypothetical protein
MVPYCDAYELAHRIDLSLKQAVDLRKAGSADQARTLVSQQCVPLWLQMAPLVRQTMLDYQAVVATRNDQGQLASMQNKLVRIALERLRLSIKEFLGTLPAEMDQAHAAAISPDGANVRRLFIPTRPSIIKPGETLRLFIVAPGQEAADVRLHTRRQGAAAWQSVAAAHAGRAVYTAMLGPLPADSGAWEYYASAGETLTDPPQAPANVHTLTILG